MSRRRLVTALASTALALAAGVVMAEEKSPKVGDDAPDFTLPNQAGEDVTLSTFRGKKHVLVAFYPKDNSPGCTNQMKCYQRELKKLTGKDVEVIALSADTSESHAGFAKSFGLRFTLLADTELAVAKQYDVFVQTAAGGFAGRAVFLVDKEGKVRFVDRDYRVPRSLRGTDLLKAIDELGASKSPVDETIAALPEPEKSGKALIVAYTRAIIGEQIVELDALHHRLYGMRPGETPAMQEERRKAEIERFRKQFKEHELSTLKLADALDIADTRVFTKETATAVATGGMAADGKALIEELADEDILIWARTKAVRLDGREMIPRQVCLQLRKQDGQWKIYAKSGN